MSTPPRLETVCPHVQVCNGCPALTIPYADQQEAKQKRVQGALYYFYPDPIPLTPAHSLMFYRNRADFWYDAKSTLGFRSRADSQIAFDAPHCQLLSPAAQQAYQTLSEKAAALELEPYDLLQHTGFLRYVILRESKTDEKRVLGIVTFTPDHAEKINELVSELLAAHLISGAVWIHNPAWGDTANGDIIQEWGETTLSETMNGHRFTYSFPCFFQTNPQTAEKAQKFVLDTILPTESVLDLYCGVGLFSIPLAMRGQLVKGIEMTKESIVWARKNAHANGLDDEIISFTMGDVPNALQECEKNNEKYGVVLLDPPRSGLSKKIWRRVLRLEPTQLVYVACSLDALKRDLEWLKEYADFSIANARAFDFFPHTEHVETIVDIRIEKIKEFPKGG